MLHQLHLQASQNHLRSACCEFGLRDLVRVAQCRSSVSGGKVCSHGATLSSGGIKSKLHFMLASPSKAGEEQLHQPLDKYQSEKKCKGGVFHLYLMEKRRRNQREMSCCRTETFCPISPGRSGALQLLCLKHEAQKEELNWSVLGSESVSMSFYFFAFYLLSFYMDVMLFVASSAQCIATVGMINLL